MSSTIERNLEEVGWQQWEAQFSDGGNGGGNGNDGGNDDNGGDGWSEDDWDEDPIISLGLGAGIMLGVVPGALAGGFVNEKYCISREKQYIAKHHIVMTPSARPAIEAGLYQKATDPKVEAGLFFVPVFAVVALSGLLGHKIEQRLRR